MYNKNIDTNNSRNDSCRVTFSLFLLSYVLYIEKA